MVALLIMLIMLIMLIRWWYDFQPWNPGIPLRGGPTEVTASRFQPKNGSPMGGLHRVNWGSQFALRHAIWDISEIGDLNLDLNWGSQFYSLAFQMLVSTYLWSFLNRNAHIGWVALPTAPKVFSSSSLSSTARGSAGKSKPMTSTDQILGAEFWCALTHFKVHSPLVN